MKDENVLCLSTQYLKDSFDLNFQYWHIAPEQIIKSPFEFVHRAEAETDNTHKQLIPYALVVNQNDEVLCYQRNGSETRLKGIFSAGIGGHVNDRDKGDNVLDILMNGLCREMQEEIGLSVNPEAFSLLGMINEEESEVGHCHTGVVFLLKLASGQNLQFDAEISQPVWKPLNQIDLSHFEKWSELALRLLTDTSRRVLVSILSDYLEPNFLLIKELEHQYDEMVFITTPKTMKARKVDNLKRALEIEDQYIKCIEVQENDYSSILQQLKHAEFVDGDRFIVNITGGTKVMAIAVRDFFKSFNSIFYYVPVDKNEISDLEGNLQPIPLKYRMNLEEYFSLYGLYFTPDKQLTHPFKCAESVFEELKEKGFDRRQVKKIVAAQQLPTSSERVYYAGGWFEEYIFCRLKKELGLADNEIAMGAKIYRKKEEIGLDNLVDNEIDVMFVLANKLYVFECKISITTKARPQELIEGYMYKLAAISKDFGLKVNSYLVTTHNMVEPFNLSVSALEHIFKRQQILGIKKIIDCNCLLEDKIPLWNLK